MKKNMHVIDDDPLVPKMITAALEEEGYAASLNFEDTLQKTRGASPIRHRMLS